MLHAYSFLVRVHDILVLLQLHGNIIALILQVHLVPHIDDHDASVAELHSEHFLLLVQDFEALHELQPFAQIDLVVDVLPASDLSELNCILGLFKLIEQELAVRRDRHQAVLVELQVDKRVEPAVDVHANVKVESVNAYLRICRAHTEKVTVVAPRVRCDVGLVTDPFLHLIEFWIVLANQLASIDLAVVYATVGARHEN